MPLWPEPNRPAVERAVTAHREAHGVDATHAGSAPATWELVGEHTDVYGGVVITGLASLRVGVAASPRHDDAVTVRVLQTTVTQDVVTAEDSTTYSKLAEQFAAMPAEVDESGLPHRPAAPTGGLAARLGGVVWMMINRQVLSRDTPGWDFTIVSDIPPHAGLGAGAACDAAVAIAMLSGHSDIDEAPLRTRVTEICTQAVTAFSALPVAHARHAASVRGSGQTVSVLNYADGSLTQAPHPLNRELCGFIIAVPGTEPRTIPARTDSMESALPEVRARRSFLQAACRAFGTESLRALPDAESRVIDWLDAVHAVHGAENRPTLAAARAWLDFYAAETNRALQVASTLRSRSGAALFPLLSDSQAALHRDFHLDAADQLVDLARMRGAAAARAACGGLAAAAIAFVPGAKATNFAADLAADGLIVTPLSAGDPACAHQLGD